MTIYRQYPPPHRTGGGGAHVAQGSGIPAFAHALTAASAFARRPAAALFWIGIPHAPGMPHPVVWMVQSASDVHFRCASMKAPTAAAPGHPPHVSTLPGGDSTVGGVAEGSAALEAEGGDAMVADAEDGTVATVAEAEAVTDVSPVAEGATGGRSAGGDSHAVSAAAAKGPSAMIPKRDWRTRVEGRVMGA